MHSSRNNSNNKTTSNNKNSKKKNRRVESLPTGKEGLRVLKPAGTPSEPPYHAPLERRPIPDMGQPFENILNKIEQLSHHNSRSFTPTETRFDLALQIDRIVGQAASALDLFGLEPPLGLFELDDLYLQTCILFVRVMTSTDYRFGPTGWIQLWPMPDCYHEVTELEPLGSEGRIQLNNLDSARGFVILLTCAIKLFFTGQLVQALQLIHELHLHAERAGTDPEWWEDILSEDRDLKIVSFGSGDQTVYLKDWMTESYLRFALATLGTKVARKLYRERENRSSSNERITSKFLLDAFEIFAEEQCHYRPKSGVGFWNLAWVAQQSPRQRKTNGLEACAEALALYKRCFQLADCKDGEGSDKWEYHDDFLRANARIDAALCIAMGGSGVVDYPPEGTKGQAYRDFRSKVSRGYKAVEVVDGIIKIQPFSVNIAPYKPQYQQEIIANEKRRIEEKVPPTHLDPGETLWVTRFEVLQLWNEAMLGPYDALRRMGYQEYVYGETAGWDSVVEYLTITNHYDPGHFGRAPETPGFPSKRDHGFDSSSICAKCNKCDRDNRKCSRCLKVCYCSRECQVAHWKEHKKQCKAADS